MTQRSIKAVVGLTGFIALSWFGGSAASANYPSDPPSESSAAVPAVVAPVTVEGTLPATGADMGDAVRIGLTALATGGVLLGVSARRKRQTA